MSHFYITLPSDSSANYYPDNTIARFVTKLPERIRLEGEYEMGLAEIIYPHTWYNVDNEDKKYWVAAISSDSNRMQTVYLPSGYCESGADIAAVLNREFSRLVQDVKAEFSYIIAKAWADFPCQLKLEVRRSSECPKTYSITWVSTGTLFCSIRCRSARWQRRRST
jgi:hypothetical protein